MKKRISAILLALCTLAVLLTGTALAADTDFIIGDNLKMDLIAYNGDGGDVVVPDGITLIGNMAFDNYFTVTSVKLPSSVTAIGEGAFFNCTGMKSVEIPASVTSIGPMAFYDCESLTSVELPPNITGIEDSTFSWCSSLTSVTIPAGVTSIGQSAFEFCTALTDVYYGGSQAGWEAVTVGLYNEPLQAATIHYGGAAAPAQPEGPAAPASSTAYATSYSILVDGESVAFDAYALKDENGNDTNYLKLRDVAHMLNGSAAQFDVGWDGAAGAITIATGTAYASPNGSEMSTPFSGDQNYTENAAAIVIDGVPTDLAAITLTDANGGAYTYFKLRDLGQYLGFGVDWDAAAGAIVIDTTAA